jgi:hypothetical protein
MPTTYNFPGWSPRAPGASTSVEPTLCTSCSSTTANSKSNVAYRGREQIRGWGRAIEGAKSYPGVRHLASNMRFIATGTDAEGRDTAEGTTVLTVFLNGTDGHTSSTPSVVGEDHDRSSATRTGGASPTDPGYNSSRATEDRSRDKRPGAGFSAGQCRPGRPRSTLDDLGSVRCGPTCGRPVPGTVTEPPCHFQ